MSRFILIKRKGTKTWLGAIPVRKGITLSRLRLKVKELNKRFNTRIVTESQLNRLISRMMIIKKAFKGRKIDFSKAKMMLRTRARRRG